MRLLRRRSPHPVRPLRVAARDVLTEAMAGVLQRPGRSTLTGLGTVVGVAMFVAVQGLTATAGSQISKRFTVLSATEVTVEDASADPTLDGPAFPTDAAERVQRIDGVTNAGLYWSTGQRPVSRLPLARSDDQEVFSVVAASPGALRAMRPRLTSGRLYDDFHDRRAERVAVLGAAVAQRLGITRLDERPAVFIDGEPLTVIGIVADVTRHGELLLAVLIPQRTAERLWGKPGHGEPTRMIVETRLGAARVVAQQVAVAVRPDNMHRLKVTAPPDPRSLRDGVAADLGGLFLLLALVSLAVGTVGIANTTIVAVVERVPEIGLRRCLGARRGHVALQFLTESAVIGTTGGLVGACTGVVAVVGVAVGRQWTTVIEPWTVLSAPLLGTLTGVLAGAYPAIKAARIQPVQALQRAGM